VWYNPSNKISVNVTQLPGSQDFHASCMEGKGWPAATGTISAPTAEQPEGGLALKCVAPSTLHCTQTGTFERLEGTSLPCTSIKWNEGGSWCKKPYCDAPAPAPAPAPAAPIIGGQGDFKYQYMPDLMKPPAGASLTNCHGLVTDADKNIYLTYQNDGKDKVRSVLSCPILNM
jgi:hypothetical protein